MFLARRRWLIFIIGELLGKYAHRENTKLIPPLFKILIYCSSRISLHIHTDMIAEILAPLALVPTRTRHYLQSDLYQYKDNGVKFTIKICTFSTPI